MNSKAMRYLADKRDKMILTMDCSTFGSVAQLLQCAAPVPVLAVLVFLHSKRSEHTDSAARLKL